MATSLSRFEIVIPYLREEHFVPVCVVRVYWPDERDDPRVDHGGGHPGEEDGAREQPGAGEDEQEEAGSHLGAGGLAAAPL